MIPYGCQWLDEADEAAVLAVMRSPYLTQGPTIAAFEQAFAQAVNAPFAVAVSSATAGLHLACLALGVGPGDRVWTSPNSFVASANCGRYCGASVDFVDIDPDTLNLCPQALAAKLATAERDGTLPKVVIPVHFGGEPCAMAAIAALAERYGFAVLEDASHAVGAHYRGEPVGSCQFSSMTVFSFHPVKVITSGEGGMICCRDEGLAARLEALRSHGICRDPAQFEQANDGPWYYEQQMLGFNYRMTDLQAALGHSQLNKLEGFIALRQHRVARYHQQLAELPLTWQQLDGANRSALHLFVIQVAAERRRSLFERLRSDGIGANVHYIPIHLQPDYRRLGFGPGYCPNAESYYAGAISLPLHPQLTGEQQQLVINSLRRGLA
ncbi:MAG: UDP-4-amino-4,6-dideoxy-N-acetyl-beta-L-altrosamine transaminase [Corallincola sp.]|nr:UDP-4-amino-4,6-dideoxy-N-acetyl-beta-L-altrosamine transaminase [Corallincola sp.]